MLSSYCLYIIFLWDGYDVYVCVCVYEMAQMLRTCIHVHTERVTQSHIYAHMYIYNENAYLCDVSYCFEFF